MPCLMRLREKSYGVAKGIPTLIIAVASIDDAASVALFGVIKSILFSDASFTTNIIFGLLSIAGGKGCSRRAQYFKYCTLVETPIRFVTKTNLILNLRHQL